MNSAQQLRDLADVVETVQSGPARVRDADLDEREGGEVVAQLDIEVTLPLAEHVPEEPAETEADGSDEPIPVTDLTDVASGLGESITARLEEAGFETVADVEAATQAELGAVPRLGPKTVDTLLDAVDELREAKPPTEDPDAPPWTPDNETEGTIVPTRTGQSRGDPA